MLFKKENTKRRVFPKLAVISNNDILELNIYLYIYIQIL